MWTPKPSPASAPQAIRVGPRGGHVRGTDHHAIQQALDLARRVGAREVRLAPGTYVCADSVRLVSGVVLTGTGEDTVLTRPDPVERPVLRSVNHYERVVAVEDPAAFPVGTGIHLEGRHWPTERPIVRQATVLAHTDKGLVIDRPYVGDNFWLEVGPVVVRNTVPVVGGEDVAHTGLAHLRVDGRGDDAGTHVTRGACVYLWHCRDVDFRAVTAHHAGADGIGFEVCEDVRAEGCTCHHCFMAMHAGSGSLRMRVRDCRLYENARGFYFCWGIQQGELADCTMEGNAQYGISIGFHDSHNAVRRCTVRGNGQVGLEVRAGHYPTQSPVDDLVEGCRIEDNGPADAPLGVRIDSAADEIELRENAIRESRANGPRGTGVRIAEGVGAVRMADNRISGFAHPVEDLRPADKRR